jgi:L-amino acid N-acyltransferase YncA
VTIREATDRDLEQIRVIQNQGIADRSATLDEVRKTADDVTRWALDHGGRYTVLVADDADTIQGWASLNRYSPRAAYDAVADLSIYVRRESRGRGVGKALLAALEAMAIDHRFHKIVLFAIVGNIAGRALYENRGFREVGTFREQGKLDGAYVDVLAMEKILES